MSESAIRAALETALAGMSPDLPTAWENDTFTPPGINEPYQEAALLLARPDNSETGRQYTQRGYMQVSLRYPLGVGTADVTERVEALKALFVKPSSFTASGVTVNVDRTPEVIPGRSDAGRWLVLLRIYFSAQVTT